MTREGEPWFVGTDVCKSLEIANAPHALSRLDDDERMTIALNDSQKGKRGRQAR
jgi:prophage antirepressor-like protein